MLKVAAACLAALMLCSACLTAEDLECWYDDMCLSDASGSPAAGHGADLPASGR